jgi:hypothetical protein
MTGSARRSGVWLALPLLGLAVPALAQQPVTDKLQVNTTTAVLYGAPPDVAMDAGGNFIVVWQGASDGDGSGVSTPPATPSARSSV